MKITLDQLEKLIEDVEERAESDNPYSKGYLDALRYLRDWLEEDG